MSLKLFPKKKKAPISLKLTNEELFMLQQFGKKTSHFSKLIHDLVSEHPRELQSVVFDRYIHAVNGLSIKKLVARVDLVRFKNIADCVITKKGEKCLTELQS